MGLSVALLIAFALQGAAAPPPGEAPPPADLLTAYQDLTHVEPRCRQTPDGAEILVCARRGADRYRVPFLLPTPGDPKRLMPHEETARLLARSAPCAERNAMSHIGCGQVGIRLSTRIGTGEVEQRPLAP